MAIKTAILPLNLLVVGSKPTGVKDGPNGWDIANTKAAMAGAITHIEARLEALKGRGVNVLIGGNAGPELAWAAAALKLKAAGKPVTVTVILPFRSKSVTQQGRTADKSWDAYWDEATRKWFAAVLSGAAVNAILERAADSREGDTCITQRDAMLADLADTAVVIAREGDTASRAIAGSVALAGKPVTNAWEGHEAFYPITQVAVAKVATSDALPWE